MKIPVLWLSYHPETPNKGYWDEALLERLLTNRIWMPVGGYDFEHVGSFEELSEPRKGAIVVVPGRSHTNDAERLNADLAKLEWCLVILAGDEESTFPYERIDHPNMRLWVMTPRPGHGMVVGRPIGEGYPPDAPKLLPKYEKQAIERPLDWFFAGQVTHERREACVEQLRGMKGGKLVETEGFTQGIKHDEYYKLMASAKVIPCPSGPATPDTFRFYEALEAGCVPIADGLSPAAGYPEGFWQGLFGEDVPFPVITDWSTLPEVMQGVLNDWPHNANRVFAWWQLQKRKLAYDIVRDVQVLSGVTVAGRLRDLITVLIPTSPIPSHPDTKIIEETIESVREQLPESEIIIMIDGVREEQEDRSADYAEYKRRLLWKMNHRWRNVMPLQFRSHRHQASMTRDALKLVETPLVLFVEHDTGLCETFDWEGLSKAILSGEVNMIRFHFEATIPEAHKHMMLHAEPEEIQGVPLIRTSQWSQRPHLASTDFYRAIIEKHFPENARTMIEDVMHSPVYEAHKIHGDKGWNEYRLAIYAPPGNIKRSTTSDGRGDQPKFEMEFGTWQ